MCCASAALCLGLASHAQTRVAVHGGTLRVTQHRAGTTVRWTHGGVVRKAVLPPDKDNPMQLFEVQVLGSPGPGVFVLSLVYASHPQRPMGHCGAGEEQYVRVVSFAGVPRQTFEQLVESCWLSTEDATATYTKAAGLVIDRTPLDPLPVEHRRTHYTVSASGVVTERTHEILPD